MKKFVSAILCIVLAVSCFAAAAVTASADTLPRYVVLVLDVSYSMDIGLPKTRLDSQKEAAKSFCRTTLGENENKVAVVLFGSGADVLCDFTDDVSLLTSSIDGIVTDGATYFYDAFKRFLTQSRIRALSLRETSFFAPTVLRSAAPNSKSMLTRKMITAIMQTLTQL